MSRIKHHIVRLSVMSAVVVAAALPCSCERDAENVSSGLDDYYYIERMKKLRLAPAYTGDSYRWTVRTASGADSLLPPTASISFSRSTKASM